jgi:hypothetical protein
MASVCGIWRGGKRAELKENRLAPNEHAEAASPI